MTNAPHDVVSGSRDRPASEEIEEIEVTPAMIEAGVRALAPVEALPPKTEENLVTEIFNAMWAAASRQSSIT